MKKPDKKLINKIKLLAQEVRGSNNQSNKQRAQGVSNCTRANKKLFLRGFFSYL